MSADANSVVQPSAEAEARARARGRRGRAGRRSVSTPAVPAPSGRSAAPSADSTPSSASALASRPPSGELGEHDREHEQEQRAEDAPARRCSRRRSSPAATKNGQANATHAEHRRDASAAMVRSPMRDARRAIARSSPAARLGREDAGATQLLDGEPRARREDLGDLRRERGRRDDRRRRSGRRRRSRRRPSRRPGARSRGDELDVVGRRRRSRGPSAGELAQDARRAARLAS